MTNPPAGFPAEQGYTGHCGTSWASNITVDGARPGDVRGRDVTHQVLRIVSAVGDLPTRDLEAADTLRDKIDGRIASIRVLLTQMDDSGKLDPTQMQPLTWLLKHAETHLDAVFAIHDAWLYRTGGAFPLELGDEPSDFRLGANWKGCINNAGHKIKAVGQDAWGDGYYVTCPTHAELDARPVARKDIKANFAYALKSVRCAEYWLWKIKLVEQADPGSTGLGLKPGGSGGPPGTFGGPKAPLGGLKPGGDGGDPNIDWGELLDAVNGPPPIVEPDPEGLPGGVDSVPERAPLDADEPSVGAQPKPVANNALLLGGLGLLGAFAYMKLK